MNKETPSDDAGWGRNRDNPVPGRQVRSKGQDN
jgi:hypothetical protein